jgi:hypothetical protein
MVGIEVMVDLHRDLKRVVAEQFRYCPYIESLLYGQTGKCVLQIAKLSHPLSFKNVEIEGQI